MTNENLTAMEWLQLGVDQGIFSNALLDEFKAYIQHVQENSLSRDEALDLLDSHEFSTQLINELVYNFI